MNKSMILCAVLGALGACSSIDPNPPDHAARGPVCEAGTHPAEYCQLGGCHIDCDPDEGPDEGDEDDADL